MLVGAMPRRPGMERKDLLLKNAEIFRAQGKALDQYAATNVKVRSLPLQGRNPLESSTPPTPSQ